MTDRSGPPATPPTTVPIRTCVGCRRRDSWSALLRVVAARDEPGGAVVLVPDPRHRLPGRGAWLHPSTTCLEQAVRRKAFTRALHLQSGPDTTPVAAHLEAASTSGASTTAPQHSTTSTTADRSRVTNRRRVKPDEQVMSR